MHDENELRIPEAWQQSRAGLAAMTLEDVERALASWEDTPQRNAARALVMLKGAEALPGLATLARGGTWGAATVREAVAEAMSVIPTDEAFETLVAEATRSITTTGSKAVLAEAAMRERPFLHAMSDATARFPGRTVRLLAPRAVSSESGRKRFERWLAAAVGANPDRARDVSAGLGDEARALVEALIEQVVNRREASAEDVPTILLSPPWAEPRDEKSRPAKRELTPLEVEESLVFWGDERARFADLDDDARVESCLPPEAYSDLEAYAERVPRTYDSAAVLLALPLDRAADYAKRWKADRYMTTRLMPAIVERLGVHAIPAAVRFARVVPKMGYAPLVPIRSPRVAPTIAHGFLRKRSARPYAERWLRRHPEHAAVGLIPPTLGHVKKARAEAIEALRWLVRRGESAPVLDVAERYGVRPEVELLVMEDPLVRAPKQLPELPSFANPSVLPAPELRKGAGALPVAATTNLLLLLAISEVGDPHAGLKQVRTACTEDSLARFGWALFDAWIRAGAQGPHRWAFFQLAWLGDDEVANELDRLMKQWPREGGHQRAVLGLDVLAEMPGEVALSLVHAIAERSSAKGLKKAARAKLLEIAERRGLEEDDLLDRVTPRLGLGLDGRTRLDFGPRAFWVGFDERLQPYVADADGKRRRSLPKPGKSDDPVRAGASTARFKQLKKSVRSVAKTLLSRFERAMVEERRWIADDFRTYVVSHPLTGRVARGLVFQLDSAAAFWIDESGELADADDEVLELDARDRVRIVHPLNLSETQRVMWGERLADYDLIQPFPQLGREIFHVADCKAELERAHATPMDPAKILGLKQRGWIVPDENDDGVIRYLLRRLPGHSLAAFEFTPGLPLESPTSLGPQELFCLTVERAGSSFAARELPPITYSELMRDIAYVQA